MITKTTLLRWARVLLIALVFVPSLLFVMPTGKADAVSIPFNSLPEIDDSVVAGLPAIAPGTITAEFVSRNEILVKLPAVPPYPSSGLTLDQIFGGSYIDSNSDETGEYIKQPNSTNYGYGAIDQITDWGKVKNSIKTPYHLAEANPADIQSIELTIAFRVGNGTAGSYIMYLNTNGTWQRVNKNTNGGSEVLLDRETGHIITPTNTPNFNIIGAYNDNQKAIKTFETGENVTFNLCETDQSFRKDCSVADEDYLALTGTMDNLINSTGVVTMTFALSGKTAQVAGGQNTTAGSSFGSSTGTTPKDDSCESAGGALGWIICPAILAMDSALNWLDTQIQALLSIDSNYYNNDGFKRAWGNIRNVAYFLLIPTMLIMVIGTALGVSALDAYTVKKAMPRLLVAVVFVALSYEICTFFIEFTNVVGAGVIGILTQPFNGSTPTGDPVATLSLADLYDVNSVLSSFATSGIIAVAGAILLFLFYGPLLLGVIIAFLVLLLRQMFIVGLVLAAPLAILAWIFPGNDAPWKLWRLSFTKLLLMYPLIMAIIALGRIFSVIIYNAGGAGISSLLVPLMILIAFIIPYVFIPATFKFAGGFFANLTGMVNDRGKGAFDRMRKRRHKRYEQWGERAKGDKFFKGAKDTGLRADWNKRIQKFAHLGNVADTGITRVGKDWRSNIAAGIQATHKAEQKKIMEDELFNVWSPFDDVAGAGAAVANRNGYGIRRRLMKEGIGTRDANGNIVRDENGELVVQNQQELDAAHARIMSRLNKGDRGGALRQMLLEAKTFHKKDGDGKILKDANGNEIIDTAELEKNVSHFTTALRKYGDEPLAQALVKKAAAGGTYYDKTSDVWLDAELATQHDGAAHAEMASSLRGTLTNAGRADQGGGSFGRTGVYMQDLGEIVQKQKNGQITVAEMDRQITEKQKAYVEHIIDNSPASVLFHYSMKENYSTQNLMPILKERLQKAAQDAVGKPEDSPEFAKFMRLLADTDNIHQSALGTKPAFAEKLGDNVLNASIMVQTTPDDPESRLVVNSAGQTVSVKPVTVRGANSTYKTNPVWQRYHKEWITSEEALRQQEAAARGGNPQNPGVKPGGEVGPGLGKLGGG